MVNAKRVYLVRHCQTTGQAPEAPLTADGVTQAKALSEFLLPLGVRRIISSPFRRARTSIEPYARRVGLPVEIDDRLRERALSGVPLADSRERLRASFDDFDLCIEGGESSRTAMTRAAAALHDALRGDASPVLLVTHGNLLTLLLRSLDERYGFDDWASLTNPDVFCVEICAGQAQIERVWR